MALESRAVVSCFIFFFCLVLSCSGFPERTARGITGGVITSELVFKPTIIVAYPHCLGPVVLTNVIVASSVLFVHCICLRFGSLADGESSNIGLSLELVPVLVSTALVCQKCESRSLW
jgi:hypothetical protein